MDVLDDVLFAARAGELQELQELAKQLSVDQLLAVKDEYSESTPLHMASANNHLDVVQWLLEQAQQASDPATALSQLVNAKNSSGNTPLNWASLNGHLEVVKVLCEQGKADAFIQNEAGHDAIYEAQCAGHEEVIDYLLEKFDVAAMVNDDGEPDQDQEQDEMETDSQEASTSA